MKNDNIYDKKMYVLWGIIMRIYSNLDVTFISLNTLFIVYYTRFILYIILLYYITTYIVVDVKNTLKTGFSGE